MGRAIDADELIKKAWDADTRVGYVQVVDVGDIEEAPTIDPVKQEWISVKDRLPPDGNKPYLTCRKTVKGRTVIESRYLHTSYESPCVAYWEGKKNGEVTHWMPLPESPETE